jgi:hypothetical protein
MSESAADQPQTPSPPAFTIAEAPFDDTEADVVLCSTDKVHFRVFKHQLSRASPVFKDMFKLPQPSSDSDPTLNDEQGRPIINMSENTATLRTMLAFCILGMSRPALNTLENISIMIGVMVKYDMNAPLLEIRRQLLLPTYLRSDPLRVFAIACRYKFRDEAILAMKQSIYHPTITPYVSELENIPAAAYHSYLSYRNGCGDRLVTLTDLNQTGNVWGEFPWGRYAACKCQKDGRYDRRMWYIVYAQQVCRALSSSPCVEVAADPEWFRLPIKMASSCSTCGVRAAGDLYEFASATLIPQVRRAITQVSNHLRIDIQLDFI